MTMVYSSYLPTTESNIDLCLVCWAHFLCKNIELSQNALGHPFIRDPRDFGQAEHHLDLSWLRSGYFLRWNQPFDSSNEASKITLIVFSPSSELKANFEALTNRTTLELLLLDPFSLLVVIAEDVFVEVNNAIYKWLRVLQYQEKVCMLRSSSAVSNTKPNSWFSKRLLKSPQNKNLTSLVCTTFPDMRSI